MNDRTKFKTIVMEYDPDSRQMVEWEIQEQLDIYDVYFQDCNEDLVHEIIAESMVDMSKLDLIALFRKSPEVREAVHSYMSKAHSDDVLEAFNHFDYLEGKEVCH